MTIGSAVSAQEVGSMAPLQKSSWGDAKTADIAEYIPDISVDMRGGYVQDFAENAGRFCGDGLFLNVDGKISVVNWPIMRLLMSYYASAYVRLVTGMKVYDATAGFVCYTRKVLERMNFDKVQFIGYAFQIEMKYTATKLGFKIAEVPIIFTDRVLGTSKMSMKIFKEAFFGVFSLRFRNWKKY